MSSRETNRSRRPSRTPDNDGDAGAHVSLTPEQDAKRIEGLRILARIIARHRLSHPEAYPDVAGEDP